MVNSTQNNIFPEIKGCLGFGCMRFIPINNAKKSNGLTIDEIFDINSINKMFDTFIESGYNYFDTAHGYHDEMSEQIVKKCLVDRYPRDKFILANKLSGEYFSSANDILVFFKKQLEICGVDYFDMYLMHAQGRKNYKKYKKCNAYKQCLELKKQGKIRHFGISFHDTHDVLEHILAENPEIEFAQIQLNFLDWDDPAIESKKCLEVCNKYDVPVIVMEPLKGSRLSANAQIALRFAGTQPGVFMTLSGMSELKHVQQNCQTMSQLNGHPKKLNQREEEEIANIVNSINKKDEIRCSACMYCTSGCPKHINIPQIFACYNKKKIYKDWNQDYYYRVVYTAKGRRASDCIECKKCEQACPQHLPITKLLKLAANEFDQNLGHH